MLIIRNDEERKQANMPSPGWLCGGCAAELNLYYPIIFVGDRHNTGYHLACAAQLASGIIDAIADYLGELSPAKQEPEDEELTDMAKAFRAARLRNVDT